ncbi:MAG: YgfZ/GcvT domain-containing protein [Hyphomicrobiaceae bacterium]
MSSSFAVLSDRGVVRVAGTDAGKFLQGLITNDIDRLATQPAIHTGLLTPQGKILFEFFVVKDSDGFPIDIARGKIAEFVKRLTFYKLRAAVTFEDLSATVSVFAVWGDRVPSVPAGTLAAYRDPRLHDLGERRILPATVTEIDGSVRRDADAYHAHRIALGVPEGGKDYAFGETFPHDANFDVLDGVAFDKGCFVGQEVVSRVQHRSAVRKRIVAIAGAGPLPPAGTKIMAGTAAIGTLGSVAGTRGLALVRLDRAEEAAAGGQTLMAGELPIAIERAPGAPFGGAGPATD